MLKKFLLSVVLLLGMFFLLRVFIGDFLRLAPEAYLVSAKIPVSKEDFDQLGKLNDQLLLSKSWDPWNPKTPEYLGIVAFLCGSQEKQDLSSQISFLRQAVGYYDEALALRPNYGRLWSNKLNVENVLIAAYYRSRINPEYIDREMSALAIALRRANLLAPWDPDVLRSILVVGLFRGSLLSSDDRKIVEAASTRAKKINFKL